MGQKLGRPLVEEGGKPRIQPTTLGCSYMCWCTVPDQEREVIRRRGATHLSTELWYKYLICLHGSEEQIPDGLLYGEGE